MRSIAIGVITLEWLEWHPNVRAQACEAYPRGLGCCCCLSSAAQSFSRIAVKFTRSSPKTLCADAPLAVWALPRAGAWITATDTVGRSRTRYTAIATHVMASNGAATPACPALSLLPGRSEYIVSCIPYGVTHTHSLLDTRDRAAVFLLVLLFSLRILRVLFELQLVLTRKTIRVYSTQAVTPTHWQWQTLCTTHCTWQCTCRCRNFHNYL